MMEFYLAHGAKQIRTSYKDNFKIDHPEKKYESFWTHKMNISKDKMGFMVTLDENYEVSVCRVIKKEDNTYKTLKVRLKVDDFRKWLHGKLDPFLEDEEHEQENNNEEETKSQAPKEQDDSLPW